MIHPTPENPLPPLSRILAEANISDKDVEQAKDAFEKDYQGHEFELILEAKEQEVGDGE